MPLQFACPNCQQNLQTPDGTEGKRAKCPHCDEIVLVPVAAPSPPPSSPNPDSPFREFGVKTGEGANIDANNPYAVTSTGAEEPHSQGEFTGELKWTKATFELVTSRCWKSYSQIVGPGALYALIVLGISVGSNIVTQGITAILPALGQQVVLIVLLTILSMVIQIAISIAQQAIGIRFGLNVVRQRPPLEDLFSFGRYAMRILGVNIIIGLVALALVGPGLVVIALAGSEVIPEIGAFLGAALIVAGGIAAYVIFFRWMVATFFVMDRDLGVFDSLRESSIYMRSNKLTAFGIFFVVGLVGILFILVTCLIGLFFFVPYIAVLQATLYVTVTGQLPTQKSPTPLR